MDLRFRLLNVFSIEGDPFSGNQLCVFEDAAELSDTAMQSWARQFNLSETAFVTRHGGGGEADVRIFTASYEMPFAGHPTLGTAHVVADLAGGRDEVALTVPAGRIPVVRVADRLWQLTANAGSFREVAATPAELAGALGLDAGSVVDAGFADVGTEQLLVQVADVDAVRGAVPDVRGMHEHMTPGATPPQTYVWAWTGDGTVEARMFAAGETSLEEDPATGSAAANLGAWLAARGHRDEVLISQGAQVSRPSRLVVTIGADATVRVGGRVTEVGTGIVHG